MKDKSSRNRTLQVNSKETNQLLKKCKTLSQAANPADLENVTIHQDVFTALPFLPSNFIDLMIVDPPYNLAKSYAGNKFRKMSEAEYQEWLESWIVLAKPSLKANASLYVCSDWSSSKMVQNVLEKHFTIHNRITWEREKGRGAKANWKNNSEDIWFCSVSKDYFFDVDAVKLKRKVIAPYKTPEGTPKDWEETANGNFRLTYPSNLWTDITLPFWSMPENTDHPTQKPEKLIAKLILASSKKGDLVFDPFLGSGTTSVVAKKLGRKYLGIEQESLYCQYAIKRLENAEKDKTIQGYFDGAFWERNTLNQQRPDKGSE